MRLVKGQGHVAQLPQFLRVKPFGQMQKEPFRQGPVPGLLQQDCGLQHRRVRERGRLPIRVLLPAQNLGVQGHALAFRCQKSVIGCVVLRGAGKGGAGRVGLTQLIQRAAFPIGTARQADRRADGGGQPAEVVQPRLRIAQMPQGDKARDELQISVVAAPRQVVRGGNPVGHARIAVAQQAAGQQGAAFRPVFGPAQRFGAAAAVDDQGGRFFIAVLAHAPDEPLIGKAGIVRQGGGHRLELGIHAGRFFAQGDPGFGQLAPVGPHAGQHPRGLGGLTVPQKPVQTGFVHLRQGLGIGLKQGSLLFRGEGQGQPGPHSFGAGSIGLAKGGVGADQRERPFHRFRLTTVEPGQHPFRRGGPRHRRFALFAQKAKAGPVRAALQESLILVQLPLAGPKAQPFHDIVRHLAFGRRCGRCPVFGPGRRKCRAQTGDLAGLNRPGAGQKQAQRDKAQAMAKTVGAKQ